MRDTDKENSTTVLGPSSSEKTNKQHSTGDALTINLPELWQQAVLFVKKYHIVLLLLIPLFLSVYIRMTPLYLPATDDFAQQNVENSIRSLIAGKINAEYPQLPEANKQQLVEQGLTEVKQRGEFTFQDQRYVIKDLTQQASDELKMQFQNEDGHTYLLDIDTYYFARQARNYVEHGFEEDAELDGKYYSTMSYGGLPTKYRLQGASSRKVGQFHTFFQVLVYKVMDVFTNFSIFKASYYTQMVVAALAVIPAFFIGKKIAGIFAGFFASLIVAIHPSFLPRTLAGVSDTDGYNVLFPLLIMWFFLEALEAKDFKKSLLFASLAGAVTGLFSSAWGGWWFIFDFVLLVFVVYFVYEILKILVDKYKQRDRDVKQDILTLKPALACFLVFIIVSGIFVSFLRNPAAYVEAIGEPLKFSMIKDVGTTKIWPNVLTTVAELNEIPMDNLIQEISLQNVFLMFCALLGLLFTLLRSKTFNDDELMPFTLSISYLAVLLLFFGKIHTLFFVFLTFLPLIYVLLVKRNTVKLLFFLLTATLYCLVLAFISLFQGRVLLLMIILFLPLTVGILYTIFKKQDIDIQAALLLSLWLGSTLFASTKGVRFLLLLVPAFALASSVGLAKLLDFISTLFSNLFSLRKSYVSFVFICFSLILLVSPTLTAYHIAERQFPIINDQWYNALDKINTYAAPDAIITSWWDFGHWFKYVARRAVTFDGGSQDTPMAHWVGKALLTSNEQQALGILRMLDCGSYLAYDSVYNYTNDEIKSINLLYALLPLDKNAAEKYLTTYGLTAEQREQILTYTHCAPPEGYFITSQDMVGKAGVWAHFGSWNFTKAMVVSVVNKYPEQNALEKIMALGYTSDEAKALYLEVKALGDSSTTNNWIAPWPNYFVGQTPCKLLDTTSLICGNGILYNISSGVAAVYTQEGSLPVSSLAYMDASNNLILRRYNVTGEEKTLGVTLYPQQDVYLGVIHDPALTDSMFNRLFYLKGSGLRCFDLFEYQKSVTGEDIFVWKIDWSCSTAN